VGVDSGAAVAAASAPRPSHSELAAWIRDFRLATGCTGIGTAHLHYLGGEVAAADPKEAAFKSSVASGTLADHYYRSASDWANGAGPLGLGYLGSLRH